VSEELKLHVFTAEFGMYVSARLAAEALVQERPEIVLQTWDWFALSNEERHNVPRYPTVRLYRGEKLLGESSCALWCHSVMRKWVDECLVEQARGG
jgi:hypothetical protein